MLFLLVASLFIFIITSVFRDSQGGRNVNFLIVSLLLTGLCGIVTYTPDWEGYQIWIDNGSDREVFFRYISRIVNYYGFNYSHLHLAFIAAYSFCLVLLISHFTKNLLVVVVLYLSINFLFYTTQIRFFLAYYLCCTAFYQMFILKRKLTPVVILLFALLNHYSVVLFIPIFYFFKVDFRKFDNNIIIAAFLSCLMFFGGFQIVTYLFGSTFGSYLLAEKTSSFIGGLYFFFPSILSYFFIYRIVKKKALARPELLDDPKFKFLYCLSFFPYIYIGIAFFIQIIGHRFIYPSILFQLLIISYLERYNSLKETYTLRLYVFAFLSFYLTYIYYLPLVIFNNSPIYEEVIKIISSNSILQYILE
jgi:hypothetical protein